MSVCVWARSSSRFLVVLWLYNTYTNKRERVVWMKRRGMNSRSPPPSAPIIDREDGGSSETTAASGSSNTASRQPPHEGGEGGRGGAAPPAAPPSNTNSIGLTIRTMDDSFQVDMDPKKDVAELKQRVRGIMYTTGVCV